MINTTLIENAVPLKKQQELKHILFETLFPWFYQGSLSNSCPRFFDHDYPTIPGFAHVFFNEQGKIGNLYEYVYPIIENSCKALKVDFKEIYYGRTFLQMPGRDSSLTIPHVDVENKNHIVLLYYVIDSDGDTVLFNRKHDMVNNTKDSTPLLEKDIIHSITPKQGTVLAFDGSTYHANKLPTEHQRCVINFTIGVQYHF